MSYGCKDRAPFAESFPAQDSWTPIGFLGIQPRMVTVTFRMARECVYQKNDKLNDPQCVGCKWKEDLSTERKL